MESVFSHSKGSSPRRKILMPTEGIKICQDFFNNVSQNPTLEQRLQLVEEIKAACPGFEYTPSQAYSWFYRKRHNTSAKPVIMNFPSGQVDTLRTLLKPLPQPPSEVVEIWAKLLNLEVGAVMEMIAIIRKENQPEEEEITNSNSNQAHLPTPGMSTSPEPHYEDDFTHPKHEPPISPIITIKEPLSWPVSPDSDAAITGAPAHTYQQAMAALDRQAAFTIAAKKYAEKNEILRILQECLQSSSAPQTKSFTAEEIDQVWLEYKEPIIKHLGSMMDLDR